MLLTPHFEDQTKRFQAAFELINTAIAERTFPGASLAVTQTGELIALKSFGKFTYAENASLLPDFGRSGDVDVDVMTLFDLASLTKPIATTTMAMILYERGLLELEAPIVGTVPEFLTDDARRQDITFRMLLAHSSGLPAYEKLFLRFHTRDALLQAAFITPLTADPGTRTEYSDIGFIILGVGLERIAEESLDVFCQREIFGPLGMSHTTFNPPKELRNKVPPTADERSDSGECGAGTPFDKLRAGSARELATAPPQPSESKRSTFRNKIIQGEVQDENAWVLGGIAGHAGLFSTAEDVARLAQCMLEGGAPILRPESVALFTRRESTPPGTSRALGWDTPSQPSQSGKYFGPLSYGHLGYTGTSLWIDPDRQLSITLLTNRTWPDCSNQAIKRVRPIFHDAIIQALES
jgi:CubicO group peptidase (beta-lactamase class C family)